MESRISWLLWAALSAAVSPGQAQTGCTWIERSDQFADRHANVWVHMGDLRTGQRLTIRGEFPHARYMSLEVYDASGRIVDSLTDTSILEIRGWNPFLPGMNRTKPYFGEFEIDVRMEERPAADRPANTLYVGAPSTGGHRLFLLLYRTLLLDRSLPGGNPPRIVYRGAPNQGSCPVGPWSAGPPKRLIGAAGELPPRLPEKLFEWTKLTPAATGAIQADIRYTFARIGVTPGRILFLTIPPFQAPVGVERAEPFPESAALRYWSVSFGPLYGSTERTLADFEIPQSRHLYVGLGGTPRPVEIPPEEWVGLNMITGFVTVRQVLPVREPDTLVPKWSEMTVIRSK
ncbi:MAG: hypothetical protein ABI823_05580 [Bryobacteraceae bacterium]